MKTMVCMTSAFLLLAASAFSGETVKTASDLLELDRAFARVAAEGPVEAVWERWSENCVIVQPGGEMLEGIEEIKAMTLRNRSKPGFKVSWTPKRAKMAESQDLGYTFGILEMTRPDESGALVSRKELYVAIWAKQPDGRWQTVLAK